MAFPVISSTTTTSHSADTANPVVGLPASIAAGDTLLGVYRCASNNGGATLTITFPGGWTTLYNGTGNADDVVAVAWAKADGSESDNTILACGAHKGAWLCHRITSAADPAVTAPEAATGVGNSDNPEPPELTPTGGAKDYLWLAIGTAAGSPTITNYPDDFGSTQLWCDSAGGGATGTRCVVASSASTINATALNPSAYTLSAALNWFAATVAIHPAAAAGGAVISPYYANYYLPMVLEGA